jgi:hypothetical protein
MSTASKSTASPTTTRINATGDTEVTHPALPNMVVSIHAGGKGHELYAESSGVCLPYLTGKSYKTIAGAMKAAREYLDKSAATHAENEESHNASVAAGCNVPPPRGTFPWMDAVQDAWDAGADTVVVKATLDL